MKLTMGQIHDIVAGLAAMEDHDIKLSGDTILNIAINLNTLRGLASSYEKARTRILADLMKTHDKNNQELEAAFVDADAGMRAKEEEVSVRILKLEDFDLAHNPKIRPATVARLMPILTGIPKE